MAPFMRKCVVAITGSFGPDRDERKVQKWVEANGGIFMRNVDQTVTHLVCSKDAFKRKAPMVKQALKHPRIKIVTFDWLEDSLHKKFVRSPVGYSLQDLVRDREATKEKKKTIRKERELKSVQEWKSNVMEHEKFSGFRMLSEGYHTYRDDTGFEYSIKIWRVDQRSSLETYTIRLWETHAPPSLYRCTAAHEIPNAPHPVTEVLTTRGCDFDVAMNRMKAFFAEKTLVDWDDRLSEPSQDPLAFTYLKPSSGPYGRMLGDEEALAAAQLNEELASYQEQTYGVHAEDPDPIRPEDLMSPADASRYVAQRDGVAQPAHVATAGHLGANSDGHHGNINGHHG